MSSYSFAQPSVIETIQNAQNSIVSIKAENINLGPSAASKIAFDPHSGRLVQIHQTPAMRYQKSGSGVIIDAAGVIVTNLHTVYQCQYITVGFHDGKTLAASLLSVVGDYDLAFLKVTPVGPLQAISFMNSDLIKLGEDIVTVGSSPLLNQTISGGKIIGVGTHASSPLSDPVDLLQVNINIYHGDSGGPLLDTQGRLVGMMVAKQNNANRSSFAIPSNKIKKYYEAYLKIQK